jgi:hypothetical protein
MPDIRTGGNMIRLIRFTVNEEEVIASPHFSFASDK